MNMNTIGEILAHTRSVIEKRAFVPNPTVMAQQQVGQLSQQVMQMAQGAPPEVQQQVQQAMQQIQQMPPEQQMQALQQLGQELIQASGQAKQQGQDPAAQQGQRQPPGAEGAPAGDPAQQGGPSVTDLENTTVTLKLRELLDLTSGGKATGSAMKVQEHIHKFQSKRQQLEQQSQTDQQKAEQQAQQSATQQDASMAANGPNMMGQGGVY